MHLKMNVKLIKTRSKSIGDSIKKISGMCKHRLRMSTCANLGKKELARSRGTWTAGGLRFATYPI